MPANAETKFTCVAHHPLALVGFYLHFSLFIAMKEKQKLTKKGEGMLVKAKKGFKVCRKSRGRYYSLYEMGFARLAFRKGTWTVPNKGCGPITLFAKLPDAEFLCRKSTIKCSAIVEVSYLPSENDAVAKPLGSVSLARLEDINASILIPGSTKLAQAVKMIKEMA